ncbi:substrate-binding domain-containing protein [Conexibacter woesei]|uniref:ABC-type phosphate transport system periplasmic component-like protein n=1 Tax=Conexibacter woesei (strain DSM 14684 / CCUG 47730 / CIP 108061 / JCM 11494 / NBRC 100937 / ID131577) TaxID=469383 RepID=D3FCD6_CONWI|nr:substrate-binding domain-containing protein [Conexibacter woesei]ADB53431.1 ABC-type phosphate transport system periplasmic component-like protein [Conexibacter woesei DSM 14684]
MSQRAKGLAGALIVSAALLAGPASSHAATVFGSGSSASVPYLEALFKAYRKVDPKTKFVFTANNGNAGAKDVQDGKSAFAIQTRPPLPSDSGLSYSKLFLDGLCVAVNPANSVSGLRIQQVADIFLGTVTEWPAVGSSLNAPISAFGRFSTAGLYTFFQSAVLRGQTQATNVTALDKDGEVAVAVSRNQAGIGYVGLANSGPGSGVKRLSLDGQPCAPSAIRTLKYPLSRYAWLVLPARSPNRTATKFGDWVRTSYAAGRVIDKAGAVPAFNAKKPPKKG